MLLSLNTWIASYAYTNFVLGDILFVVPELVVVRSQENSVTVLVSARTQ